MQTTLHYANTRRMTSINVTDGPVMPCAFSKTGRLFKVERINIEYMMNQDSDAWDVHMSSITVSGTVLKKDGTPGSNDHARSVDTRYADGIKYADRWAWVKRVVDHYRPTGKVVAENTEGIL